jgi:GTP diphosphokinase / guanosine-3',5'-bis(diphosphate) 3'-diphosphatase
MTDLKIISDALCFAMECHRDQRRKDKNATPYINHLIGTMRNVVDAGINDIATICAAILHDTIEDTTATHNDLLNDFGKEIADIVMECTDDKTKEKAERKRLQVANAAGKSDKAKIVKMADKLYNTNDLLTNPPPDWDENKIKEYFNWAKTVTDQMKGVNAFLEKSLDEVYRKSGCIV